MVSGGRVAPLVSSRIVKIRVLDNGILRVLLGPSVDSEHHRYKQALFAPLVSSSLAQRQWYLKGHVSDSQMTPGVTWLYMAKSSDFEALGELLGEAFGRLHRAEV